MEFYLAIWIYIDTIIFGGEFSYYMITKLNTNAYRLEIYR